MPILYQGPHSQAAMNEHLSGSDSFSGSHAREGIVINPVQEREHWRLGRVKLKAINTDHLLRPGEQSEYN